MKLVIEIDEEDKKELDDSIKSKGFCYFEKSKLIRRILFDVFHGKVISEGHGRLGDLDALEKELINGIRAGNLEEGYEQFDNINCLDDCVETVRYADTIIEADEVEE